MAGKAAPAVAPKYAGLPITKRTLNFGIGGSMELPDELTNAVPRSVVTLRVVAELGSVKHIFADNGTVEERTILTIEAASAEVLSVAEPEPQPEQTSLDGEGSED